MTTTTLPTDGEKTRAGLGATAAAAAATGEGRAQLGWMLAGPAFFVMLAVTAYPILKAVYVSLFDYRLTDPDNRSFIGSSNYGVDPHRPAVVAGRRRDRVHHGGHGRRRAGARLRARDGDDQGAELGPAGPADGDPHPLRIITVVSAFAWQFAFAIDTGFVNSWFAWLPGLAPRPTGSAHLARDHS